MKGRPLGMVLALACLILAGMWWLRPRPAPGPQSITLEGTLPQDPNAEVRAFFPELNYTASCRASELGQPGQPFKWRLQVPGKPGQVQMQTARPHLPPVSGVPVAIHSGTVQVSPPPAAPAAAAVSAARPQDARRLARQKRRRERQKQRRLAIRDKRHDHHTRKH